MANNPASKRNIACVTGGTGMIGRRIVERLLERDYSVRVLTRKPSNNPRVQEFRGDISSITDANEFVSGADLLFHCAGEISDGGRMWSTNVIGTENIVRLIERHKIKYFCHLSSAGVVGRVRTTWIDEDMPCNPQNRYEATKLEAERIAMSASEKCHTVILRPTNVVDETHLGDIVLPLSGSRASKLKARIKGAECAHIVHAEDVAEAAVYFMNDVQPGIKRLFVSLDEDPDNTVGRLWSLFREISDATGSKNKYSLMHFPVFVPHILRRLAGVSGNPGNVRYSSERLRSEGFVFSLSVREIVKKVIADRKRMIQQMPS